MTAVDVASCDTDKVGVAPTDTQPEHRSERRRFLIWAYMAGLVQPERVTERILAEINVPADEGP